MIFTIVFDFLTILYIDIFVLSEKKKNIADNQINNCKES